VFVWVRCVWVGLALVPAYNEEHYVVSVLVRLMEYIERVIVCDDGSVDLMGEMAEALDAVGVGMIRVRRV
jgi:glycosyltransferase involved in cell wall biosynthesis